MLYSKNNRTLGVKVAINFALIGSGRIGKLHAENLMHHVPNAYLKAIYDPNLDEEWASSLKVDLLTKNLDEILNNQNIDAVIISAPSSMHIELIEIFAKAKKHIFCEKPIGFEPHKIRKVTNITKNENLIFQVGFNRRYDANFIKIKKAVSEKIIGDAQIIRITDRDPEAPSLEYVAKSGGIFMDFSIHDFDMARFVSSSEAVEIYCAGNTLIEPKLKEYNDIDTAISTLKMSNGALCVIDNSRQAVYGYDQRLEVFGSKGSIEAKNNTQTNTVLRNESGFHSEKPYYFFLERYKDAYIKEIYEFAKCIVHNKQPCAGGEDAAKAVCIAQAAKQSLLENKPIKIVY
ncbi:inositol 2-dehydrogenase [Sulfobacillus acidophilus]|uniref:Inositol 2-dehydrogenase n=1 Tax=Sulfobacillus acidophilus TaxID=53633 RepID=A0ABS3AWA7_9FIRM|nr:inositol 2-dehydrogenase [Sulfobacillus acidophilus]